jgi:hypothetical protein
MGYYKRKVLLIDETRNILLIRISVARFRCREKEKAKIHHATFSLLPEGLIPYNRIHIDLFLLIFEFIFILALTIPQTLEKLDSMSPEEIMLSEKTIERLLDILKQTRIKLILFINQDCIKNRAPPDFAFSSLEKTFRFIMSFDFCLIKESYSPARNLSVLYYEENGSYLKNSHFLFGKASQFCL